MTTKSKWLGPWRLDREQGVWRRRMRKPLVHAIPVTTNGNPLGASVFFGYIVHYAETVVPLKTEGRATDG